MLRDRRGYFSQWEDTGKGFNGTMTLDLSIKTEWMLRNGGNEKTFCAEDKQRQNCQSPWYTMRFSYHSVSPWAGRVVGGQCSDGQETELERYTEKWPQQDFFVLGLEGKGKGLALITSS